MTRFRDPVEWEATLPVRPSSPAWRAAVKAVYGTPLDDVERELFLRLSGGREPPEGGAHEVLVVAGRRAGKSETIARLAVFEALHGGHGVALAPGQLGVIPVISPLREQSREIMNYASGLVGLPEVRRTLARAPTADSIAFRTHVELRIITADAVSVSGPTSVGAIFDEAGKLPAEGSAMPDTEIDGALRPALAPLVGAPTRRLIKITSAFLRQGLAYQTDVQNFGDPGSPVLVLRGDTETFNPSIDRAWLARERRRVGDRVFAREYLCEWQSAVEAAFEGDVIAQCTDAGVRERPPEDDAHYAVGIDLGLRRDRTAIVVLHRELRAREGAPPVDCLVVDYVRVLKPGLLSGVTPFGRVSLDDAEREVNRAAKLYRVRRIHGDLHYADAMAPRLRERGLRYVECSSAPGAQEKRGTLLASRISTGGIRLVDHPELLRELRQARTRVSAGRTLIEAPNRKNMHDDVLDALLLAVEAGVQLRPSSGELRRTFTQTGEARWYQRIGDGWVPTQPPIGTEDWFDLCDRAEVEGFSTPAIEAWLSEESNREALREWRRQRDAVSGIAALIGSR